MTKNMVDDSRVSNRTKERGYVFPLYIHDVDQGGFNLITTQPNIEPDILREFELAVGIPMKMDSNGLLKTSADHDTHFAPIDLFDFTYAVLSSPFYTAAYREPLCVNFPRVPYPKNASSFWTLADYGSQLRELHLLTAKDSEDALISYPAHGDNVVRRKIGADDVKLVDPEAQLIRIWINDEQYFEGIPKSAWELFMGGYQPAQKWLRDRKGSTLSYEDIVHYQRIIVSLTETLRVADEIDQHMSDYLEVT